MGFYFLFLNISWFWQYFKKMLMQKLYNKILSDHAKVILREEVCTTRSRAQKHSSLHLSD